MLTTLRKRVRVIMIVVAVAFVAGFLMGELWRMLSSSRGQESPLSRGIVAEVGGRKVTTDQYRSAIAYITDKYRNENQLRDLSNEDYVKIEDQAWKFLVSELTWGELLKKANVFVTEDEIIEIMKANPPEELRSSPELLDEEGNFDQQKYLDVMNNPRNQAYFSQYFRDLYERLPKEKLRIDVMNSYRTTGSELNEALRSGNGKWKVTSLYFGPKLLAGSYEPTEAEMKAWYQEHREDYESREVRSLRYVFFPLEVSADDSAEAWETVDRAYQQLLAGESFNLTMVDYSELLADTMPEPVLRDRLDAETDSVVRTLRPGQYSEPYLTDYGWQIVQFDSTVEDTVEAVALRRILVRVKMGTETVAAARDSVRDFIERVQFEAFDSVAAQMNKSITDARPMVGGEPNLAGVALNSPPAFTAWALRAKAGDVMDTPVSGPGGYYVFQLTEVAPKGYQEFEQVKSAVGWKVRQAREREGWMSAARSALEQFRAGVSLENCAAANPGVELAAEEFNGVTDARRRKGAEFAGAVYALETGETTGVVESAWGAFIIRCDSREETGNLKPEEFVQGRQQEVARDVLAEMLKDPEIRDYRDPFSY
jgi:peptidyl-prolyl cis-trans isomerase D